MLLESGLLAELATLSRMSQHYRAPVGSTVPYDHLDITYVTNRIIGEAAHARLCAVMTRLPSRLAPRFLWVRAAWRSCAYAVEAPEYRHAHQRRRAVRVPERRPQQALLPVPPHVSTRSRPPTHQCPYRWPARTLTCGVWPPPRRRDGKRGVDPEKFCNQVVEFAPGKLKDGSLGVKVKYQLPLLEQVWEVCYAAQVRRVDAHTVACA